MELVTKFVLGIASVIGSCCALSAPLSFSNLAGDEVNNKEAPISVSVNGSMGGGTRLCRDIKNRVVESVLYIWDANNNQERALGESSLTKPFKDLCVNASVKRIVSSGLNSPVPQTSISRDNLKKGITSLVDMAISKVESSEGSGTWGGNSWSGNWLGTRGQSFYLTGNSGGKQYLIWKEVLNNQELQNSGEILVAKKESIDEKVNLTIGVAKWNKQGESPQIQVKKEDIKDWRVTVEFRTSQSTTK